MRKTRFNPRDYAQLKQLLMSQPRKALVHFPRLQIYCLADLPLFWQIARENRSAALCIAVEAAAMGIPLEREEQP